MEKFQSRVIYKGLSQFTGNSIKSIVTLVARLRFCFPQTKKKKRRGEEGGEEREKQKKKKKSGKRGKFIYRSRFPLLFISFVARLKTRAAINRNWRNSLCILLADSIGGTILFEIYASLKNRLAKNTMYLPALFNNDPTCPIMLGIWCIELGKACIFPIVDDFLSFDLSLSFSHFFSFIHVISYQNPIFRKSFTIHRMHIHAWERIDCTSRTASWLGVKIR